MLSELVSLWQLKVVDESTLWLFNWQLYAAVLLLLLMTAVFAVERLNRAYASSLLQDYLYGVIHTLVMVPTYTMVLVLQKTLTDHYLPWLRLELLHELSIPMQILVAFVLGDFLGYLSHYLKHRIQPLWYFHLVHHSQEHLNPFTTKRTHIVEHLFSKGIVRWIPMAVMGSPLEVWLLFYWILAFWDYFVHSNLKITLGPLRWLLVSPQYHRIHHSKLATHFDRNFGANLVVWDLLFGTACMDRTEYPPTGTNLPDFPRETSLNPLRQVRAYYRQWCYPFKLLWRASSPPPAADPGDPLRPTAA